MNREELTALRDAIGVLLTWPDSVRAQVAAWLKPEASAKPNGHDPNPTKITPTLAKPKARRHVTKFAEKTAEQRLLAAMQEHSGVSVNALAKAAGANRSSTGERLRGLARAGKVTKDSAGHWRLVAELAGEAAGPTEASPS